MNHDIYQRPIYKPFSNFTLQNLPTSTVGRSCKNEGEIKTQVCDRCIWVCFICFLRRGQALLWDCLVLSTARTTSRPGPRCQIQIEALEKTWRRLQKSEVVIFIFCMTRSDQILVGGRRKGDDNDVDRLRWAKISVKYVFEQSTGVHGGPRWVMFW